MKRLVDQRVKIVCLLGCCSLFDRPNVWIAYTFLTFRICCSFSSIPSSLVNIPTLFRASHPQLVQRPLSGSLRRPEMAGEWPTGAVVDFDTPSHGGDHLGDMPMDPGSYTQRVPLTVSRSWGSTWWWPSLKLVDSQWWLIIHGLRLEVPLMQSLNWQLVAGNIHICWFVQKADRGLVSLANGQKPRRQPLAQNSKVLRKNAHLSNHCEDSAF